jgi:hypothetical protein
MDTVKELPIFCENCPTLAFANFDDAPLCEACLLEAVKHHNDLKIEPLQFKAPKMYQHCNTDCIEISTP